ncbi:hypothetical protein EDD18DRAFT_1110257 [Armillaria luteobubalina]|uniref:Thioesterase domain-containing protein n=1 Tax=Armillaria luteobubalina TaxID=153913 RepID=A0AA39PQ11_9AGAR|nr:hypothetical protein EDD18DRAFT_1110257 [Armillaria luteobubalina]
MTATRRNIIKVEQLHGPYRLASYSATSILLTVLVKLFEDNGDTVLQAVMRDGFPATFIYSANKAGNPDPRNPDNTKAILDGGIKTISGLMEKDGNRESLQRTRKQLLDAWDGMYEKDSKASIELLERWMRTVKAPITVVVTHEGSIGSIPKEDREEWADLGVKRCLPDAKVVFVSGEHYEFLTDEGIIGLLQEGY